MAEGKTSMNLEENVASMVCYIGIFVTGLIFFFMEKENKTVRFHAMQSILTFLPLTILNYVLWWIGRPKWNYGGGYYGLGFDPGIPALVWLSYLLWVVTGILWLILVIKSYQGEKFKVPFIGDIAENQVK